ncbi:MAG: hypothetical protein ACK559_29490, partial [bacterium]
MGSHAHVINFGCIASLKEQIAKFRSPSRFLFALKRSNNDQALEVLVTLLPFPKLKFRLMPRFSPN